MLCLVRYLFVSSTSVIDCLGRFIPEMTYYVSSGTLNLAQLNSCLIYAHSISGSFSQSALCSFIILLISVLLFLFLGACFV